MPRLPGVLTVEFNEATRDFVRMLGKARRNALMNALVAEHIKATGKPAVAPVLPEIDDDEPEPVQAAEPLPMPAPPAPPPPPPAPPASEPEQVESKQSSVQEVELVNDGVHYIIRFMPGGTRKFYRVDPGLEGGRTLKFLKDLALDTVIPEQNIIRGTIPGKPSASPAQAPAAIQPPPVVRPPKPATITYPFEVVQGQDRFKIISIGGAVRLMKLARSADGKQVQFQPVGVLNPQQVREWWGRKV